MFSFFWKSNVLNLILGCQIFLAVASEINSPPKLEFEYRDDVPQIQAIISEVEDYGRALEEIADVIHQFSSATSDKSNGGINPFEILSERATHLTNDIQGMRTPAYYAQLKEAGFVTHGVGPSSRISSTKKAVKMLKKRHSSFQQFNSPSHFLLTQQYEQKATRRRLLAEQKFSSECERLIECVNNMTSYDFAVFFYDDYVNRNSTFSYEILTSDGLDLISKIDNINSALRQAEAAVSMSDEPNNALCTPLLDEFHGACIDQVCESSNARDYVSFAEINDVFKTVDANTTDTNTTDSNTTNTNTTDTNTTDTNTTDSNTTDSNSTGDEEVCPTAASLACEDMIKCAERLFGNRPYKYVHETLPFSSTGDTTTFPERYLRDRHGLIMNDPIQFQFSTLSGCGSDYLEACEASRELLFGFDISVGSICEVAMRFPPLMTSAPTMAPSPSQSTNETLSPTQSMVPSTFPTNSMVPSMLPSTSPTIGDPFLRPEFNMPGECCLDSPAERTGDLFGSKISCDANFASTCIKPGPWFSRLSEEACDQVGGIWCDRPCIELQECLPDAPGYPQHALIRDPYDATSCHNARIFLGLDHGKDSFHDTEICCAIQEAAEEDITEMPSQSPSFPPTVAPTNEEGESSRVNQTDCVLEEFQIEAKLLPEEDGEPIATNNWEITYGLLPAKALLDSIAAGLECAKDEVEAQREIQIGFASTSPPPAQYGFGLTVIALKATMSSLITARNAAELGSQAIDATLELMGAWDCYVVSEQVNRNYENVKTVLETLQQFQDTLDKLKCPYSDETDPWETMRGMGCDGKDQNCNEIVDECAEDQIPPSIIFDPNQVHKVFGTTEEAKSFLYEKVQTSDDCAVKIGRNVEHIEGTTCFETEFLFTATHEQCLSETLNPPENHDQNLTYPGGANTAQKTFVLPVDGTAPNVTCGFTRPQEKYHILSGDPESLPAPAMGEPLHIISYHHHHYHSSTSRSASHSRYESYHDYNLHHHPPRMVDVGFFYEIEDDCPGALNIDITLTSNELNGAAPYHSMAFLSERCDGGVTRPQIEIAPLSCTRKQHHYSESSSDSDDGDYEDDHYDGHEYGYFSSCHPEREICIADPQAETRFYDIIISATDAAGNVGTATCQVIVVPPHHYPKPEESSSKSAKTRRKLLPTNTTSPMEKVRKSKKQPKTKKSPKKTKKSPQKTKKSPKKSSSKPKEEYKHENPQDLIEAIQNSTQRFKIGSLSFVLG